METNTEKIFSKAKTRLVQRVEYMASILTTSERSLIVEKNREKWAIMLGAYRRIHKVTQKEVAAEVGVSQVSISKWERGEVVPEIPDLIKFIEALGPFITK